MNSRMVVTMGWGWGKRGDVGQSVHTSSYKMNKFWGSNIQHGDYNYQCCITYLKIVKSLDFNCYHHPHKKMVIM